MDQGVAMTTFLTQIFESFQFISKGIVTTLEYTAIAALGGFFLGLIIALLKVGTNSFGVRAAQFYTSVFRGTPMLLQLSLVYFGIPSLTSYKISPLVAGTIAFSLNSAAYVSEIIRSGIQSIDKGQFEASHALNIPRFLMMKDIILPQAIRNVLPALVNEIINLLKETALISTIGEADIMRRAQLVASETFTYFEPLLIAAACYYFVVMGLSSFAKYLEKRLSYANY
jgi:His/Glu/Gln/Arg/opine family amino acid ABC transporter permease subunit